MRRTGFWNSAFAIIHSHMESSLFIVSANGRETDPEKQERWTDKTKIDKQRTDQQVHRRQTDK